MRTLGDILAISAERKGSEANVFSGFEQSLEADALSKFQNIDGLPG